MDKRYKFSITSSGGKAIWVRIWDTSKEVIVSQVTIDMYGEYFRYKDYCNGNKIARIVRLETSPSYIGLGFGSEVLKKSLEYLDKCGYNAYLLCSPQHREANDKLRTVEDLKKFYSKFGFKPTSELLPTMVRKASIHRH